MNTRLESEEPTRIGLLIVIAAYVIYFTVCVVLIAHNLTAPTQLGPYPTGDGDLVVITDG